MRRRWRNLSRLDAQRLDELRLMLANVERAVDWHGLKPGSESTRLLGAISSCIEHFPQVSQETIDGLKSRHSMLMTQIDVLAGASTCQERSERRETALRSYRQGIGP
jgi:hypothetical protein